MLRKPQWRNQKEYPKLDFENTNRCSIDYDYFVPQYETTLPKSGIFMARFALHVTVSGTKVSRDMTEVIRSSDDVRTLVCPSTTTHIGCNAFQDNT